MFLSAGAIAALAGQRKVHFLNPLAVRTTKSLGDVVGLKNIGVHLIEVLPNDFSTEYHRHYIEEECIYVLSGSGIARLGEERYAIAAGDFIGCPANDCAHSLQALGNEPLQCLVMGQRLMHDIADYPDCGKRLYRSNGEWSLIDLHHLQKIKR